MINKFYKVRMYGGAYHDTLIEKLYIDETIAKNAIIEDDWNEDHTLFEAIMTVCDDGTIAVNEIKLDRPQTKREIARAERIAIKNKK